LAGLVLILTATIGGAPTRAGDLPAEPNGVQATLTWTINGTAPNQYITITGVSNKADNPTVVNIPTSIQVSPVTSLPVTHIGDNAFGANQGFPGVPFWAGLEHATIPEGITHIGDYAFAGSAGRVQGAIESIELPNSLTYIGAYAFSYTSLKSVVIPSVQSFGPNAFSECYQLTDVEFKNGTTYIPDYTFSYCRALRNIKLPTTLETIGASAFNYCELLERIEIPANVTHIGNGAFAVNLKLTHVVLLGNNTNLAVDASLVFAYSNNIQNIGVVDAAALAYYKANSNWLSFAHLMTVLQHTIILPPESGVGWILVS